MTIINENILSLYYLSKNNTNNNILNYDESPSFSKFPNMPLFKYGFYYYIHQTKNKMEIFEKTNKSKDVHKIVNQFEDYVLQDDPIKQTKDDKLKLTDDINSYSIKYFNSEKIISRAFYKLWELLMMFPLIKDDSKNITTIHIAEAPGSFVQAIIYYRNKFFEKDQIVGDNYIATSIDPNKNSYNYVPIFNKDLNKIKQFKNWSYKDSDLTKIDIVDKFVLEYENKADFVTADGGFNWKDENFQEQEAYLLLLSEVFCAIKIQKNGGCFVLKIFEVFTELTVKIIEILKTFYENVIIVKPLLSRSSNSEKYLVCINFISNTNIEKIYNIIKTANNNKDKYLVDIFPYYQIDTSLDLIIKLSSTQLSNEQHRQINEMITYYNAGNYYGDEYRKYLVNRREANDFWISTFYPQNNKDLNNVKLNINSLIKNKINQNKQILDVFQNKLNIVKYNYEDLIQSSEYSESSETK
jgi:23S rRNA U2552 (ribose-2'-O)-methylase RlmE/FtsJ